MTTQLISFEGVDDAHALVVIDGVPEQYHAYDGAQFHLVSRQGQMQVTLLVDDNSGCWSIGLGQTSEAHPIAKWRIDVEPSRDADYTPRVTIHAPADTELVPIE